MKSYLIKEAPKEKETPMFTALLDFDGHEYEADIIQVSGGRTSCKAIHGGRILYFFMTKDLEPVAIFKNGEWEQKVEDLDAASFVAVSYFLNRYNKVHSDERETEIWVTENVLH